MRTSFSNVEQKSHIRFRNSRVHPSSRATLSDPIQPDPDNVTNYGKSLN
ncbi:hypothetical protein ISN44_As01g021330 [Arabidopsis suecica]|uniref:Uncharacterized protein n=1 Tax=Arabidopsis suecica TaxID=45249 RepID=A0A8T2H6A3_ARASU|nr:hypothetical protein ISN44_As01g021330 [Arabidopsis suecica]